MTKLLKLPVPELKAPVRHGLKQALRQMLKSKPLAKNRFVGNRVGKRPLYATV